MNAYVVPNFDVMLNHRHRANADVVSDAIELADVHLVTGLEVPADDVARVNDGVRPNDGAVADRGRQFTVSGPSRRRTENAVRLNDCAVAERYVPMQNI